MQITRKEKVLELGEQYAKESSLWREKNHYFHQEDMKYLQFLIPQNLKILDLGCGLGDKLAYLKPSYGLGVDFSPESIKFAKERHPNLEFVVADIEDPNFFQTLKSKGQFDIVLISDVIGYLDDCQTMLSRLKAICHADTRIIVSYYNRIWDPVLKLAEIFGQKLPQSPVNNYLSTVDIDNLLKLSGFESIRRDWRQLIPKYFYGIGAFINRFVATLPGIRALCLRNYIVARPKPKVSDSKDSLPSTTVVITCRNERGNVEPAIKRLPKFCENLEILFVEGHSKDGTLEEIHRVIKAYPEQNIRVVVQDGKGKGDAVRKAFDNATGDILMILDGDLTTPPEDMPKFYQAIVEGHGEFVNGTRLVYPMENEAMRTLNHIANKCFSWGFSYLLNQRFTDTLCGTKVLYRKHYRQIAANRDYFGDFDPFGDFDLIFGASKLNLKIVEIPIRYAARTYGSTQISRFVHGWLLLKMVIFAYRKLKAI